MVLSGVVAHGDLVRAEEGGRVTAFVAKRFQTRVHFAASDEAAAQAVEREGREGRAARAFGRAMVGVEPVNVGCEIPWACAEDDEGEMRRAWGLLEAEIGDLLKYHDDVPYYVGTRYDRGWRHLFAQMSEPGRTVDGCYAYAATRGWRPSRRRRGMRLTRAEHARRQGARRPRETDGVEYDLLEPTDAARTLMWARASLGEGWSEAPLTACCGVYWPRETVRTMLEETASSEPSSDDYPIPLRLSQVAY